MNDSSQLYLCTLSSKAAYFMIQESSPWPFYIHGFVGSQSCPLFDNNTINRFYKHNSYRLHQRSWTTLTYYILFSVTQNVGIFAYIWETNETFFSLHQSWKTEQMRDSHRVSLHFRLLFPHGDVVWHLAVRYQAITKQSIM